MHNHTEARYSLAAPDVWENIEAVRLEIGLKEKIYDLIHTTQNAHDFPMWGNIITSAIRTIIDELPTEYALNQSHGKTAFCFILLDTFLHCKNMQYSSVRDLVKFEMTSDIVSKFRKASAHCSLNLYHKETNKIFKFTQYDLCVEKCLETLCELSHNSGHPISDKLYEKIYNFPRRNPEEEPLSPLQSCLYRLYSLPSIHKATDFTIKKVTP